MAPTGTPPTDTIDSVPPIAHGAPTPTTPDPTVAVGTPLEQSIRFNRPSKPTSKTTAVATLETRMGTPLMPALSATMDADSPIIHAASDGPTVMPPPVTKSIRRKRRSHKRKKKGRVEVEKMAAEKRKPKKKPRCCGTSLKSPSTTTSTPLERFRTTRHKSKSIVVDETTIHAWIRDCFHEPTSSLKVPSTTGATSVALKDARNGFPTTLPRSSSVVRSTSASSHRIALLAHAATVTQEANDDPSPSSTPAPPLLIHNSLMRRYLMEDILFLSTGDRVLFAVAEDHPFYGSYKRVYDETPPHPTRTFRDKSFIQLPATIVGNTFRSSLINIDTTKSSSGASSSGASLMSHKYFSNLLLPVGGNGGGAISIAFDGTKHAVAVSWNELDALKSRTNLHTRHSLFQRLLQEVDGDRALTFLVTKAYSDLAPKQQSSRPSTPSPPEVNTSLSLLGAACAGQIPRRTRAEGGMVIIKLGGSSITDKGQKETLNKVALDWLSDTLLSAIDRSFLAPDVDSTATCNDADVSTKTSFVVVHGAGSFGHHTAKEFGLQGQSSAPQIGTERMAEEERRHTMMRMSHTRLSVQKLNQAVVENLIKHGVNAVSISPCLSVPGMEAHGGSESMTLLAQVVQDTLEAGLVPVIHGDACLYGKMGGGGTLGGDALVEELTNATNSKDFAMRVVQTIFLTDVEGVYTKDPNIHPDAKLLKHLEISPLTGAIMTHLTEIGSSHQHVVTGGLETKLGSAARIARSGTEAIIAKCQSSSAEQGIRGDIEMDLGTIVQLSLNQTEPRIGFPK
eukprot:scaffold13455_cov50-Attheya_sp.AAC.6